MLNVLSTLLYIGIVIFVIIICCLYVVADIKENEGARKKATIIKSVIYFLLAVWSIISYCISSANINIEQLLLIITIIISLTESFSAMESVNLFSELANFIGKKHNTKNKKRNIKKEKK